jgi:hypothetical protein
LLHGSADRRHHAHRLDLVGTVIRQFFFLIGQPRTRSAWLSNWFTTEWSFCLHDPWRFARTAAELRQYLEQVSPDTPYLGAAGSMSMIQFIDLCNEFGLGLDEVSPDTPYLGAAGSMSMIQFIDLCNEFGLGLDETRCEGGVAYIRRNPEEVYESGLKMDLGLTKQQLQGLIQQHEQQFKTVPSFVYDMPFKKLDDSTCFRELHEYLTPEIPFDLNRYRNLNDFKVEIIMDKYKKRAQEGEQWLNSLQ